LKKLDDLGVANNAIVIYTTDNGAETFTWPFSPRSGPPDAGNEVRRSFELLRTSGHRRGFLGGRPPFGWRLPW